MTTQARSQCAACVHFRSPFDIENEAGLEGPFCAAFPAGIPDRVYENRVDHRKPITGDNGVRWTARQGDAFPEYALATTT